MAGTLEESWPHRISRELRFFYSNECEFCRVRRERIWRDIDNERPVYDPAIVDWQRRRSSEARERQLRELRAKWSTADLHTALEYYTRRAVEIKLGLFGDDPDSQELLRQDGDEMIAAIRKELEHRSWLDSHGGVSLAPERITRRVLDDIRERFDLIEYIGATEGRQIKRQGNHAMALCAFHQEKTPSMMVHRDHFHCFGCGEHGDLYDWIRERENLDFIRSVEYAAGWCNIALPGK